MPFEGSYGKQNFTFVVISYEMPTRVISSIYMYICYCRFVGIVHGNNVNNR